VFLRHLGLIILCGWLSGIQGHYTLYMSFTQNNKYQVSQKHSCFSWWWAHSCPKHVEIDKYMKNKFCTKLVLFWRFAIKPEKRYRRYKAPVEVRFILTWRIPSLRIWHLFTEQITRNGNVSARLWSPHCTNCRYSTNTSEKCNPECQITLANMILR